jgi:hypothetical protein
MRYKPKSCRSPHSVGWFAYPDAGRSGTGDRVVGKDRWGTSQSNGMAGKSSGNDAAGPECGQLRHGEQTEDRDTYNPKIVDAGLACARPRDLGG